MFEHLKKLSFEQGHSIKTMAVYPPSYLLLSSIELSDTKVYEP